MKPSTATNQVKAPNYTESNVQRLKAVYQPDASEAVRTAQIAQLAEEMGKTPRSIIAKLGTMKNSEGLALYVPKDTTTRPSVARSPSRSEIVRQVEAALGMARDSLPSLARSNKGDLEKLMAAVPQPEPEPEAEPEVSEA